MKQGGLPDPDELFTRLELWARDRPDQPALAFVRDLALDTAVHTYAEVLALGRRGAAAFHAAGLRPGDRVLIDLPTGEAFVAALLGAFHCGLLPAAVAPLETRTGPSAAQEWRHHLDLLHPAALVTDHDHDGGGALLLGSESILNAEAGDAPQRVAGTQMGYLQFSSGSTGAPKALVLEMEGIVFNLEEMRRRIPVPDSDVMFSWLPLHHDMGLFGALLLPLYAGTFITLMDPALFARSPSIWFRVMHEIRAGITVGPPSALLAALKLLQRRPIPGLDLSNCSRWLCGAEQVSPNLARTFAQVLEPYGMPMGVLKPVYGMAEITLAATMPPAGRAPRFDLVQRDLFEREGVAAEAADLPLDQCLEWTGCGHPLDGQELRIADQHGAELPARRIGRILLRSPSLYTGFLVEQQIKPRDNDWHDTGDLGYWAEGDVFITGRSREVIIKNGRNYAPERLEELATTVEGTGRGAAFGIYDPARETERVVLVAEVHPRMLRDAEDRDRARLALRNALVSAGFEIDQVELRPRGSLPRTTSGKIRRAQVRKEFLADGCPQAS